MNDAPLDLLLDQLRIDHPSAIHRRDRAGDPEPLVPAHLDLDQAGDVRAEGAVAGQAHAAAARAAVPAADRGGGREALGEARIALQEEGAEGERLEPRGQSQLVDEAFGEPAGVAVRRAAPQTGFDADLRLDMVDCQIGNPVGRPRPGDRGESWAREAAGGADPAGDLDRGDGGGDARGPGLEPALLHPAGHPRPGRRAIAVPPDLLAPRPGELHRAGHLLCEARRLLDRHQLELAAIAAAGEGLEDGDQILREAGAPGRGGAGEAGRLAARIDFEPVADHAVAAAVPTVSMTPWNERTRQKCGPAVGRLRIL